MRFTYTGDDGRFYHDVGEVVAGQVYQLDANPDDGRWVEVDESTSRRKSDADNKDGE